MAKRALGKARHRDAPQPKTASSPARSAGLRVYRVARGLGNACVLLFPDQSLGIVDWGTLDVEPLDDLVSRAIGRRIRFIAATHAHADHTLGLEALIERCRTMGVTVDAFVYPVLTPTISPKSSKRDPLTRAVIAAYYAKIPLQPVVVGTLYDPEARPPALAKESEWEVRVLAPASTDVGSEEVRAILGGHVAGNATSLVLSFWFRRGASAKRSLGRILLPGDATPKTLEFARETAARFPDVTLANQAIVVPHHGGANTLPEWFARSIEGIAIVSGPSGSQHHPHRVTLTQLATLARRGESSTLFCTSYSGACERAFGHFAMRALRSLVQPGPCFGHIDVGVPANAHATVERASDAGELRRPFGWCGQSRPEGRER